MYQPATCEESELSSAVCQTEAVSNAAGSQMEARSFANEVLQSAN
jgi:hypothetical protein